MNWSIIYDFDKSYKNEIVLKANMDPMIVFFPSYMVMFFSLKIDSLVSLFSKNQNISIKMEINFHQVSELRKDLYLVVEDIFSGYDFLLDLHSRVSFSLQIFSSSPGDKAEGECGSFWAMEQRNICLSPPRFSEVL